VHYEDTNLTACGGQPIYGLENLSAIASGIDKAPLEVNVDECCLLRIEREGCHSDPILRDEQTAVACASVLSPEELDAATSASLKRTAAPSAVGDKGFAHELSRRSDRGGRPRVTIA
jgi:hypothetical protein